MAESPLEREDTFSYQETLDLIRDYFKEYKRGELKKWAEEHKIHYFMFRAALAETAPRKLPKIITKVLTAIGYDVQVEREIFYKIRKKS